MTTPTAGMSRTLNGVAFPTPEPVLLQTTLNLAKAADECGAGLGIAKELGIGPDDPANLLDVLRVGGLYNAVWCMRCVLPSQEADRERVARLIAAECAARVLHLYEAKYPGDNRPRWAVEAARDYALGLIGSESLKAVKTSIRSAAIEAGAAAREDFSEAVYAMDAALAAVLGDTKNAAGKAAYASVEATSWSVELEAQATTVFRSYLKGDEA